jgi:methylenetetrahydrofolate--tRNA-(uracil-5-)-methyltransferase
MCLKAQPRLRFAGQITGVEGYVESGATGILAGLLAAGERLGYTSPPPPRDTALGALLHHITGGAEADTFQPMNVNFGLFPPLTGEIRKGRKGKRDRALAYTQRAKAGFGDWLGAISTGQPPRP